MFGLMIVLGSVLVLRLIAAANMPADHAEAKMDPGIAGFQAFLAAIRGAGFYIFDLIEMDTSSCHNRRCFRL